METSIDQSLLVLGLIAQSCSLLQISNGSFSISARPTVTLPTLRNTRMTNALDIKVALVTAGSAGLGAAAARALASEGMRVVINYSANKQRAVDLVKSLYKEFSDQFRFDNDARNIPFIAIQANLGVRAEITHLVDETYAVMGRLDVVVSNGGWTRFSNFADLEDGVEEADWDRCFNMNVKSHLWLIHAAKKYLDETEGAFITTASLAGVIPSGSSLV